MVSGFGGKLGLCARGGATSLRPLHMASVISLVSELFCTESFGGCVGCACVCGGLFWGCCWPKSPRKYLFVAVQGLHSRLIACVLYKGPFFPKICLGPCRNNYVS